jgi:G3E family GTPase
LDVEKASKVGLFTQHSAEEFNMKVLKIDAQNYLKEIPFKTERNWVAEHEHDDEVGSIAIERFGDVDPEKLNTWMGRLLSEKGVDIFRTKGFISYSGNPRRIVFQGVHMLFTAQPDKEWGNEPRRNQLVFIGRNLNEKEMQEGFDKCLI